MKIAVLGASGFVGKNLVRSLLTQTEHEVLALYATSFPANEFIEYDARFTSQRVDVFDFDKLTNALNGVEVVYYLLHMMNGKTEDLYEKEALAAKSFVRASQVVGVKKVIYLSGLGDDKENLSIHLRSRHNTGKILRQDLPQVIEFRASIIVGQGSASFDIVQKLVRKLPIMILPKWSNTLIQPIKIEDVVSYLIQAINISFSSGQIFEIGGPEKMTYKELFEKSAQKINKKITLIVLPFLPNFMAKIWLRIFLPAKLFNTAKYMVDSLENEMIIKDQGVFKIFPEIKAESIF